MPNKHKKIKLNEIVNQNSIFNKMYNKCVLYIEFSLKGQLKNIVVLSPGGN